MARELSIEEKSRNNNNNMVSSSSGGFCYSELSPTSHTNTNNHQTLQTQFPSPHQIQDFHDHHHHEIFNFHGTKPHDAHDHDHDHDHQFSETTSTSDHHQNLMVGPNHHPSWQDQNSMRPLMVGDDSSLRCVFPCEGNERPSQGLSLTLSSNNPSSIGLQSFELRHTTNQIQHQNQMMVSNLSLLQQQQQGQFQIRHSKFLVPARELLNEFCCLGTTKQQGDSSQKQKPQSGLKGKSQWGLLDHHEVVIGNGDNVGASSSKKHSLYSLEFMESQKRKTKLLSMLEEVERRYKKYCDQMRVVVAAFEAVAGEGAAEVYSALASKAMSRHFRCLKEGILRQIQATKAAMGEEDQAKEVPGPPGMTRGETPRLKILDQTLRQQRAFQQMSMMESHPWRPQRGLPERSVSVLRAWLFEHFLHPYPSDVDKHILARQTGLSRSQVSNWFINARVRLWKPMVEEMYVEETKEEQLDQPTNTTNNNNLNIAGSSSDPAATAADILSSIMDPASRPDGDHKPTPDQLVRIDSECLSSVVINPDKTLGLQRNQNYSRYTDPYNNPMELDFSSYNTAAGLYPNDASAAANQGFIGGGSGSGVSLTLGLQQHGVSLAFSPPNSQSSLFYARSSSSSNHHQHHNNNMDDQCQVPSVQYSLLDGDQGQNLPYRNLMGAQLLHDLA